jgi:hypothetical protein
MYDDAWMFVNKFFKIWIIGILWNALLRKWWWGQVNWVDLFKWIQEKLFLQNLDIYTILHEFWNLDGFLEINKGIMGFENWKPVHTRGSNPAHSLGLVWLMAGFAWWATSGQNGLVCMEGRPTRLVLVDAEVHTRCVVMARTTRVVVWPLVDGQWHGLTEKHWWWSMLAPDKEGRRELTNVAWCRWVGQGWGRSARSGDDSSGDEQWWVAAGLAA